MGPKFENCTHRTKYSSHLQFLESGRNIPRANEHRKGPKQS